jgi:hypothetical protein
MNLTKSCFFIAAAGIWLVPSLGTLAGADDRTGFNTTVPGEVNAVPQDMEASTSKVSPALKEALGDNVGQVAAILQNTQSLLSQVQGTQDPVERQRLSARVDAEVKGLGRQKDILEAKANNDPQIAQDGAYQKLIGDITRVQARNGVWQAKADSEQYWTDPNQVSSDLNRYHREISRSLSDSQFVG